MKEFADYTWEQGEALDDYLKEVVKNCDKCKQCSFCHETEEMGVWCFFAFRCLQNNFNFFKKNSLHQKKKGK